MNFSQFYATSSATQAQGGTQAVSQETSAARSSGQAQGQAQATPTLAAHNVAISWVGVLLALVLLRILYEVADR